MHAFAGRELRAVERLTERATDFADARDVREHVGFVAHAVEVDQRLRQARVRTGHLMEHVEAPAKRLGGLGPLQRVTPQVVRRLPFARQLAAIERALEIANGAAPPFQMRFCAGFRKIVDLVEVVLAAESRLLDGAEREVFFVARVEPVVQACGLDLVRIRARGFQRRGFGRRRATAARDERESHGQEQGVRGAHEC